MFQSSIHAHLRGQLQFYCLGVPRHGKLCRARPYAQEMTTLNLEVLCLLTSKVNFIASSIHRTSSPSSFKNPTETPF